MNATTLKTIMTADRVTLNSIIAAVKLRQVAIQKEASSTLRVSDIVYFTNRVGNKVQAKVTKINRKTIYVTETATYQVWKVSPTMLTKV